MAIMPETMAAQTAHNSHLDFSKKSRAHSHRVRTAIRSFRALKGLSPQEVDNFMQSYVIYDLDWADEKTMIQTLGPDYQKRVGECLAAYYRVMNNLCAIGELEKMYIPPAMDLHASLIMNQILYEESIAAELLLPANARVLDLGCGRGRVAAHIARIAGAQVTGLNIDADQIASATAYNKASKLSNSFIRADFNDLPLPLEASTFDGFYQIQAFSLAKDHTKLLKEIYRVLKPGARVSLLDWASLEAYDPNDTHHHKLMRAIKPLIGAVGTPTPRSMEESLRAAGFQILQSNNASIDGLQAPLIERADGYFRAARMTILGLVRVGMLPTHFRTLFNRLTKDCDAFIEADRARLITTSYHWLAEKPLTDSTADTPVNSQLGSKAHSPVSSQLAIKSESPTSSVTGTQSDLPAGQDILAYTKA